MKIIDMTCPKCGAALNVDLEKGCAVCEYCGNAFLLEKEDTLEEIRAKAQSKAYGYHKGRLKAEAEASRRAKYRKFWITVIVIAVIMFVLWCSIGIQQLSKPKVNPFDCIQISFQGTDGKGQLVMEVLSAAEGIDVNRIDYDISKKRSLYQGESISINASSEYYRLTESSRVYIVEGLDEYLKDLDNIPQEVLDIIHKKAESVLDRNLDATKALGYLTDMKPVKLFLLTDGKQCNILYDVFEVNFTTNDGAQTLYVLTYFDDVIIREGEQISIDMSYGMYLGHITQVQGSCFIMAYDSLDEVKVDIFTSQESYMELKELDL